MRNVAVGVPLPRVVRASKRFLTHEQVALLAESSGRYGKLIRVLSYTGLRWGEVAALRVEHVDLARRPIEVVEAVTRWEAGWWSGRRRTINAGPCLFRAS